MIFLKAWIAWSVMVLAAIGNGTLREKYFTPRFGEYNGHVIGCLTLSLAVVLITYVYLTITGPLTLRTLKLVGLFWVLVSVAFEFFFGYFILRETWVRLFADYNILRGRFWLLVLGSQALAPVVVGRVMGYWS